jgi:diguanylate cyclase
MADNTTRDVSTTPIAANESVRPDPKGPHWMVQTHYRLRSLSFLNSFVFCAVHAWDQGRSPGFWVLLAIVFLIYPQLAYRRATAAADSQRAEMQNLVFDCFLVAIPIAVMGFPLWITFTLFIATTINNAIARGVPAVIPAIVAFAAGSLAGAASTGFVVSPVHSSWVTALCIFGLCWYLLGIGDVAYRRTLKLRMIREELKRGEQALQQANETLHVRLHEIASLQEQLHEQANRDPLTGLFNRRYLQETIERELARSLREKRPLCVMLIDIDYFKRVNDQHGHQAGDEVLKALAPLLAGSARQEDVACRYGGEEFMLLLPTMPLAVAFQRAESWRERFSATTISSGTKQIQVTISIGIAEFPTNGRTADALIRSADLALYQAKSSGRNRVASFTPVSDGMDSDRLFA